MKYKSELINEIVERRGHEFPNLHYQSECIESWIEENKGAYPKLCDYESEWLNYIYEKPIGEFPYETVSTNSTATVNNVVPFEYKSAILSGQTLVNLVQPYLLNYTLNLENTDAPMRITDSEIIIDWSKNIPFNAWVQIRNDTNPILQSLKENTEYTCVMTLLENTPTINGEKYTGDTVMIRWWLQGFGYTDFYVKQHEQGKIKFKFNTGNKGQTEYMMFGLHVWGTSGNGTKTINGGKMRFSKEIMIIEGDYTNVDIPYFEGMQSVKMPVLKTVGKNLFDGNIIGNYYVNIDGGLIANSECYATDFIEIKPNTNFSTNTRENEITAFYDEDKNFISCIQAKTFLSPSNARFLRTTIKPLSLLDTFQLEEGTTTTPYEPYKSNILSCLEPVELGSVGEVKDELNLLTQQLTQRTETIPYQEGDELNSEFVTDMTNTRYKLAQEVVKTVDLSVVNQDGDSLSKIKPIEGIMHIEVSGTPISPIAVLEVPVEAITQNLNSFIKEE